MTEVKNPGRCGECGEKIVRHYVLEIEEVYDLDEKVWKDAGN